MTPDPSKTDDLSDADSAALNLVTTAPIGTMMYRLEGEDLIFVSANAAANKILAVDCTQFVGQTIEVAFPPLADTDVPAMYRRAAREGTPWSTEHIDYDDERIHGAYEVHAFQTAPGHMAALFLDVTHRKQSEQERDRLGNQIQHMQKLESLGVLAGGIAHDFNNLLCGILGSAELILMDLEENHPVCADVHTIRDSARQAGELCKQLLAYSGKGRFVVEPVNLTDMVTGMANLLTVSKAKNIVLRHDLSTSLSPIDADPGQIQQIILNLLTNASESLEGQSGAVSIATGERHCTADDLRDMYLSEAVTPGTFVYLEVSDTGCGMDPDTLSRIFDPFFTTKFTGRGLGLAATLGIVRSHSGTIKIDSTPGRGTTFSIFFPTGSKPAASTCPLPSPDDWKGEGLVLLVDDEDTVRVVGKRVLESLGFEVLVAEDGAIGVATFEAHADRVRAILLDMTMPHMDGAEAFRHIRALRPDVPVLLISGYDEAEAISRFTEKGLAGFIQKPFSVASIRDNLRMILKG
ncbi:MAG: response regulator [Verrucomicrobia bacterium]|jgi:two-component system, cell cycle sensor histidine kinase and response regulator CckA|nr:response regulator [Verrucomicrobiota bacterium]MBT7068422.1 response regulator [Verrucomicrobiota bacterium]MBT7701170.1 response regulator [Verrucomicrobiota bacterium]